MDNITLYAVLSELETLLEVLFTAWQLACYVGKAAGN